MGCWAKPEIVSGKRDQIEHHVFVEERGEKPLKEGTRTVF